jgi:hypothetical protein
MIVLIVVGILVVLGGGAAMLIFPAIQKVREAAGRASTQNNLKQMGIGFHNIASVYNGLEPPAVGVFPIGAIAGNQPTTGVYGTGFYHLLPHIEQDHIYKRATPNAATALVNTGTGQNMATALTPSNGWVKIYCAPADPSNPGKDTLLTSYRQGHAIDQLQHQRRGLRSAERRNGPLPGDL